MSAKRIGFILLGALAITVIILVIEINLYNTATLTKNEFNETLFWSFIKGLVISIAVSIGNHIRLSEKSK